MDASCWCALDRRAPVSSLSSFASRKFLNPDGAFRRGSAHQISMKTDHYDPITAALREDIGEGDITTDFFVPDTLHATGRITAREKAIVAGTGAAAEVFRQVDSSMDIQNTTPDGDEGVGGGGTSE